MITGYYGYYRLHLYSRATSQPAIAASAVKLGPHIVASHFDELIDGETTNRNDQRRRRRRWFCQYQQKQNVIAYNLKPSIISGSKLYGNCFKWFIGRSTLLFALTLSTGAAVEHVSIMAILSDTLSLTFSGEIWLVGGYSYETMWHFLLDSTEWNFNFFINPVQIQLSDKSCPAHINYRLLLPGWIMWYEF